MTEIVYLDLTQAEGVVHGSYYENPFYFCLGYFNNFFDIIKSQNSLINLKIEINHELN